jgi:hypothetical protein
LKDILGLSSTARAAGSDGQLYAPVLDAKRIDT